MLEHLRKKIRFVCEADDVDYGSLPEKCGIRTKNIDLKNIYIERENNWKLKILSSLVVPKIELKIKKKNVSNA